MAELAELRGDDFLESGIGGESEVVVDFRLALAPGHDGVPAESSVATQDEAHLFSEAFADERHDPLQGFDGSLGGVALAVAKLSPERDISTEGVGRNVPVVAIVAVETGSFLGDMERVVGGIEINDDCARLCVGLL